MSLKVISDDLKKIFLGNDHSKLKYKKKHKKHYRTHQKKRGKKLKRKMHIRAGANATIKKERRNRKVMYPGIKPTINADEINNLDKLIKMKKEIKKKKTSTWVLDNIYKILKDLLTHILLHKSTGK